ncbi:MAG: hypothetical protein GDA38_24120 [Hormoscilla sp. SP12CHS1]|nr:hypothetical protein [Hormoscilla sp. SP12CHS1]
MLALHRAELLASNDSSEEAATSQTVASPQGATAESQPETVAAKLMVSAPETTPTSEVAKIPERAIATLRQLQQKFAYNPTTPAEALASIQAWLDASKKWRPTQNYCGNQSE